MRNNLKISSLISFVLSAFSVFFLQGCGTTQGPTGPQVVLLPHQVMVAPGETVYSIAYQHGISTRALIEANRLQAPYTLVWGQVLVIPSPEVSPPVPAALPPERMFQDNEEQGPIALHKSLEPLPPLGGAAAQAEEFTAPEKSSVSGLKRENVLPPEPSLPPKAAPLDPSVAHELDLEQERLAQKREKNQPLSQPASQPAVKGDQQKFSWPVQGKVVERYGRGSGGGDGIRIAAPKGTPVHAVMKGKVIYAGNEIKNLGNLVLIEHADGWISAYGCAQDLLVKKGDIISNGQKIALVGQTGDAKQPQLYFEIRKNKKPVDPLTYLRS